MMNVHKSRLLVALSVLVLLVIGMTPIAAQEAEEPTPTAAVEFSPASDELIAPAPDDTVSVSWFVIVSGAIGLLAGGFAGGVTTVIGFTRWLRADDTRADTAEKLYHSIPMTEQSRTFVRGLFTDMREVGDAGVELTDGRLRSGDVIEATVRAEFTDAEGRIKYSPPTPETHDLSAVYRTEDDPRAK